MPQAVLYGPNGAEVTSTSLGNAVDLDRTVKGWAEAVSPDLWGLPSFISLRVDQHGPGWVAVCSASRVYYFAGSRAEMVEWALDEAREMVRAEDREREAAWRAWLKGARQAVLTGKHPGRARLLIDPKRLRITAQGAVSVNLTGLGVVAPRGTGRRYLTRDWDAKAFAALSDRELDDIFAECWAALKGDHRLRYGTDPGPDELPLDVFAELLDRKAQDRRGGFAALIHDIHSRARWYLPREVR
jgi:hypothetical protein